MINEVTVVVPTRNEAGNLPVCLGRLGEFVHVVVVDSGSDDGTRAIALGAGVKLVDFAWDGGFPKKRNWLLRNFTFETDWVLFLDADEWLTAAFVKELKSVSGTVLVRRWGIG